MSTINERLISYVESSFLAPLLKEEAITDVSYNGKDLFYDGTRVQTNRRAVSKDDRTSGIRLSTTSDEMADQLIRRTYKVLLTRGLKGCYIYCEDKQLRDYLKSMINNRE